MKNIALSQDFFFGGKAIFTVQNNATGEHRTYKIKLGKPNDRYPVPMTFLSQMTGSDNEAHYSYIGVVNRATGAVKLTNKSKFQEGSKVVDAARWVMGRIVNGLQIPDSIEIRHAGKCGRCGRTLTNPESLDSGIGPECAKIIGCRH